MNTRIDSIRSYFSKNQLPCGQNFVASVKENKKSKISVSVFPNPAFDLIQINLSEQITKGTIELYDVTGSLTLKKEQANFTNTTINVSGLSSGAYFVKISSENELITRKIFKQ